MAGSSSISGDESIIFADNASFDGTERGGKLTSDGQLWIGSTAGRHVRRGGLTSTDGSIAVTNGAGTIDLSVSGLATVWQTISASQTLSVRKGYFCIAPGGALSLLLPPVSVIGDIIEVTLDGATSFSITQGAGQSIRIGNISTTVGVGGSITSTQQGDTIYMVCQTANLRWNVLSMFGNTLVV
jgi:hypothetical protein